MYFKVITSIFTHLVFYVLLSLYCHLPIMSLKLLFHSIVLPTYYLIHNCHTHTPSDLCPTWPLSVQALIPGDLPSHSLASSEIEKDHVFRVYDNIAVHWNHTRGKRKVHTVPCSLSGFVFVFVLVLVFVSLSGCWVVLFLLVDLDYECLPSREGLHHLYV